MRTSARLWLLWLLVVSLSGCAGAKRATVHEQDVKKVFPWPQRKQSVSIRVRPQTTMANMCVWFGSWETIEVTADTTFFITDQAGHKFAYTPSRSPIHRLAPVDNMEIRWPQEKAAPPGEPKQPAANDQTGQQKKAPAAKPAAGGSSDQGQ